MITFPEKSSSKKGESRRSFIKKASAAAVTLAGTEIINIPAGNLFITNGPGDEIPWYRKAIRWGQTNISEKDPAHYDIDWWRKYWKRTNVAGVIINAGGIIAYYPSRIPFHHQAQYLGGRDLFGDLCHAAHEDGLYVFARMDSNRAHRELYDAHPGWFTRDSNGNPYKAADLFITCINSPYYSEHIPRILEEIAGLYHPEGFTDNSWSGLGRDSICYCENCRKDFREKTGLDLPQRKDWNNNAYRQWIVWNYNRRLEIWDLNNRTTRNAGGPHCIWSGMNSGSISNQCRSFRNYKEICQRAEIIMLDSQARNDSDGFQQNGGIGKLIHGLLGWEKVVPESMAMYQAGRPTFRLSAKPQSEARMWIFEGMAGGLQPWWHFIGASHEDRRIYHTAVPVFSWHKANEEFLYNRRPVATVGVVWSQLNTDFYGRDDSDLLVDQPWRGVTQALLRDRIPFLPVHVDHIDRDGSGLSLLILPNIGALTDKQADSIRKYVNKGGGLVVTGDTGLFNEWGDPRTDFALGDLLGVHVSESGNSSEWRKGRWSEETYHTYLRLTPELRGKVEGPYTGTKPEANGNRHPVLKGFDETDILPYGGVLQKVMTDPGTEILMTFIPQFPIYPPETAWMREPKTTIPGLVLNTRANGSRIAFLTADIDRQFGRHNLPDHGNLLANLFRWAAKDNIPLKVAGPGMMDFHIYRQTGRMIVHIVNLTNSATWRQPVDEQIPVGPLKVDMKLAEDVDGKSIRLLVSGKTIQVKNSGRWASFEIPSVVDHEVVVIS